MIQRIAKNYGIPMAALGIQMLICLPGNLGAQSSSKMEGEKLYRDSCSACHGKTGRGDGPVAPALLKKVPDLTLIARGNGGVFPFALIANSLEMKSAVLAHGSQDMPVWGNVFRNKGQTDAEVWRRVNHVTLYIESLQAPEDTKVMPAKTRQLPVSLSGVPADSGAAMYYTLCAGCHGSEGRGDGPAAATLRGGKLDLSQISKNNQGTYPAQRIALILGSQAGIAAHGSKEMPVWGESFRGVGEQDAMVRLRIKNIVDHLKTLQVK